MDPKANLFEQRLIAQWITDIFDQCPEDGEFTYEQMRDISDRAPRLAELVLALDHWRRKGGVDPYTT